MNESGNKEQSEGPAKGAPEKFWDATRKTFHTATFRANQYKRVVQKKIDLASLHKKIANVHADLGKMIDDNREAGETDILATENVQSLFRKLDSLKQAAATLEEEIEAIKSETPPEEEEEKKEEAPPE
jgi:uncharacterized membrane protein